MEHAELLCAPSARASTGTCCANPGNPSLETSEGVGLLEERFRTGEELRRTNSISVVVPVYNSESSLMLLIQRLEPVLASLSHDYEAILINDGSRDGSWEAIQQLSRTYSWVRGINLMRNYGQHNALLCGIRAARFETTVTIDDDLQHPPEEIPRLLTALNGVDVVYGVPEQEPHVAWRAFGSKLTKLALQNIMGVEVARNVSAFRALRTRLRDAFGKYQSPFVSLDVLLTWGTTRFGAVRVRHDRRFAGCSNYTLSKLVRHALTLVTGYTVWPLEMASLMGFAFMLFGMGVLMFVVAEYFIHGGSVHGFPFLASLIAIFSGAQMFALGIIGEYLARMHHRMMERPVYVVGETIQAIPSPLLAARGHSHGFTET